MNNTFGLCFRKLDLHTHTPASKCYRKNHTAEEIVQTALEKGLEAIAITDHNTAAWIDKMQVAASSVEVEGRKLTIFPGVEITAHEKYHVIALFDPSVKQAEIENFLGAIEIPASFYGQTDAFSKKSIYEVLEIIHERNGLAILAHIDQTKGAFYESTDGSAGKISVPITCSRLFNEGKYDAVEVTKGRLPEGFDKQHHIHRMPPFYQSSDNPDPENPINHSKNGLGRRYTFFALDEITLEGLRQCFADPEVRISSVNHQDKVWPCILEMRIGGNGFLASQSFPFHPGLNCIIGGKGTGKSLVIEFLRFATGQPSKQPALQKDHYGKLDEQLGSSNFIEIIIQLSNGVTYSLKRIYESKERSSSECINLATGETFNGNITELFPILAYSQTEVIEIAKAEDAQLRLIDSLIYSDVSIYQRNIQQLQQELCKNDTLLAEALHARTHADNIRRDIATLQERVVNVEKMLSHPLLITMRKAETKNQIFNEQLTYIKEVHALQTRYEKELQRIPLPNLPKEWVEDEPLQLQMIQLQETKQQVFSLLHSIPQMFETVHQRIIDNKMLWDNEFQLIKQNYQETLQGSDQARLEAERNNLMIEINKAVLDLQRFIKLADEDLPRLQVQRQELLNTLDEQYQKYYEKRKDKFEYLTTASGGKLKLTLTHATNREAYANAINELWKKGSVISTNERRKIADSISPREFGDILIKRNIEHLTRLSGMTAVMAERAIEKAWASDDFAEFLKIQHAYYPEDTPVIEFNKGHGEFAALDKLSVGQKCTALLIIALCDGTMPVVMDQPEDALDIASVWEDVAKKLRRGKYGRQFILTTHNSSVAVGSDSDNFTVLIPQSANRAKVAARGAIDRQNVRYAVIDHLEGGNEPYKLRQRKYNIK